MTPFAHVWFTKLIPGDLKYLYWFPFSDKQDCWWWGQRAARVICKLKTPCRGTTSLWYTWTKTTSADTSPTSTWLKETQQWWTLLPGSCLLTEHSRLHRYGIGCNSYFLIYTNIVVHCKYRKKVHPCIAFNRRFIKDKARKHGCI